MQIESITTWYNVTKVTQSKENDMKRQQVLENIKNTIARLEQQKGSPLTLRQKLFIANHRLEHLKIEKTLNGGANEATDFIINSDIAKENDNEKCIR